MKGALTMGAWGFKTFEDDSSLDWLGDLGEEEKPLPFLKECLNLDGIDYMEYFHCTGVLSSAVMIDGLLNGPKEDLPEEALEWLKANTKLKVAPLVPIAIDGLERVLGDDSELNELWRENKELYPKWKKSIVDLSVRLEKVAPT
jgi:hypothetical protein